MDQLNNDFANIELLLIFSKVESETGDSIWAEYNRGTSLLG